MSMSHHCIQYVEGLAETPMGKEFSVSDYLELLV